MSFSERGEYTALQSLAERGKIEDCRRIFLRLLDKDQQLAEKIVRAVAAVLQDDQAIDHELVRRVTEGSLERSNLIFLLWNWRTKPLRDADDAVLSVMERDSEGSHFYALGALPRLHPPTKKTLRRIANIFTRRTLAYDDQYTQAILSYSDRCFGNSRK